MFPQSRSRNPSGVPEWRRHSAHRAEIDAAQKQAAEDARKARQHEQIVKKAMYVSEQKERREQEVIDVREEKKQMELDASNETTYLDAENTYEERASADPAKLYESSDIKTAAEQVTNGYLWSTSIL